MDITWKRDVHGLVEAVASSDARSTYIDFQSGASIRLNIDGLPCPEATEPFYITSPCGGEVYDALDKADAERILNLIRQGKESEI